MSLFQSMEGFTYRTPSFLHKKHRKHPGIPGSLFNPGDVPPPSSMSVSVCPLPGAASGMSGASGKRQETAALVQRRPGWYQIWQQRANRKIVQQSFDEANIRNEDFLPRNSDTNWLQSFFLKDLHQDLKYVYIYIYYIYIYTYIFYWKRDGKR